MDLVDAPAAGLSIKAISDRIKSKGIEALVCDTSTPSIFNDIHVVEALRAEHSRLRVLLVGRHVSALPAETLAISQSLESIAVREYEYTVRDWLEAIGCGADLESVDGLAFRRPNSQEVILNKPRRPIENLDELPFVTEVYRRFLRIPDYYYGHSLWPLVVFDTSRGCPYHCGFCVYPQTFSGHVMRYRSKESVADEFEYVAREITGVKSIMLEDDTFIVDKKRTMELAQELIRRGNKLPFDANCRADVNADAELLSTVHKAGGRLFCVGFESGDTDVIRGMHKNNDPAKDSRYQETALSFVRQCKAAGIMVHGCFMVGNFNETPASMERTLSFAKRLRPDTAQFYPIMVYPGTTAYREAKSRGYIQTEDWDAWVTIEGLHNSVVNLPGITHEELVRFCESALRRFYLNPAYLFHKLKQSLRSRGELQRNLKGVLTLSRYIFQGRGTSRPTVRLRPQESLNSKAKTDEQIDVRS
ncbi:MAG: radical SAM protein [Terracidiphilus sp.]